MSPNLHDYFPESQPNGLQWPHDKLMVAENHRILFRPIAKNACSSLKRMMVSIADIEHKQIILTGDIHHNIDAYRTGAKLLDFKLDRARQIMESDEYFKFAVIRDPFARLVSAYLEKFVINRMTPGNQHHTGPVVAAVQNAASPDFQRGITFADFVRFITAQQPERLDPHWIPQTLYLQGVDYDRIYRVDQMDTLRRELEARIGHPLNVEHYNRSHSGRPRHVPGSAHRLPSELKAPEKIDKLSFMESEIMFHIATYFADDYRLYYSDEREITPTGPVAASDSENRDRNALHANLRGRFRRLFGARAHRVDGC